jgi:hypothetical protein
MTLEERGRFLMANLINFTTPAGRMVMGDLYKPQTKDMDGKPLVVKQGPNAGQSTQKFFFAHAIAKGQEAHWSQTGWGAIIWKAGHDLFGGVADTPGFAWKVVDGDSQIPNKKGAKPCDREGYPGHWILSFTSQYAPKIYIQTTPGNWESYDIEGAVKNGYYLQVNANISSNGSQTNPGIFLYHAMVAYIGKGPEIFSGPDVSEAGFGQGPMPAGMIPIDNEASAAFALGASPGNNALSPQAFVGNSSYGVSNMPQAPPPNPAILMPPPTPVHVMTPLAKGFTYEQMKASGWTDAMLIQHGMMVS